jgi:dolichyl-diphosphooligosaccharide--protein glycosyltransferase
MVDKKTITNVFHYVVLLLQWVARVSAVVQALRWAVSFRMHAIDTFGLVIHEFDPWFNFRATQYLADNGLEKFFKW